MVSGIQQHNSSQEVAPMKNSSFHSHSAKDELAVRVIRWKKLPAALVK